MIGIIFGIMLIFISPLIFLPYTIWMVVVICKDPLYVEKRYVTLVAKRRQKGL
jgi:hypothetical protein